MKKIILPLTPQTNVRTTQNDRVLFQIPEECPKRCGLPRKKTTKDEAGCPHCLSAVNLRRKRRIEKYNLYKEDLRAAILEEKLEFPEVGAGLMFYMPMPKRWSKKKKAQYHLQWHDQKPDLDNMLKAFFDSIFAEDKKVAFLSGLGKQWVDNESGWIEVTLPADYVAQRHVKEARSMLKEGYATATLGSSPTLDSAPGAFEGLFSKITAVDPIPDAAYDGLKSENIWHDEPPQYQMSADEFQQKLASGEVRVPRRKRK